eukprot:c1864_g1_i1.p1 GENE.c1864_g1_i1~~c1864_g1_i1.p1  ORF type:complete len:227 (-),score=68.26 c1864_g1_i1:61-741(-)
MGHIVRPEPVGMEEKAKATQGTKRPSDDSNAQAKRQKIPSSPPPIVSNGTRDLANPLVPPKMTGIEARDQVRNKIAAALATDVEADGELCAIRAEEIEKAMLEMFGEVSNKYKDKFRQLVFNLKNKRNTTLRTRVRLGSELNAKQLCAMTSKELADDQQKQEIKVMEDDLMKQALDASTLRATTTQFKCGKCRKRECTYFELQTRSADEPMTVFVQCQSCGNKWKQ